MKKLLLGIALVASLIIPSLQAEVNSVVMSTNNAYWLLITNRANLESLTFISTNNVTVRLYDNNAASITYTNGAYTNVVQYATNWVVDVVTSTGITNHYTNSSIFTDKRVAAAATNSYSPFSILYVAANTPLTVALDATLARGLVVSNSTTNITAIFNYTPQNK